MSKKFLRVEGTRVTLIHYMPFDAVNGLGKTEEELSAEGVLVDTIPEPDVIVGKIAVTHYTPEKGIYYEYVDAPQPPQAPQSQNMTLAQSVKAGIISAEQFKQITGMDYAE